MAQSNASLLMARKKAYSQMALSKESRRMVSRQLSLPMVKKIYCSLMVLESESTQMAKSERPILMAPMILLLDSEIYLIK
jgi:hypothetical protein